jgi:sRNA-binding regulator protein Hfq
MTWLQHMKYHKALYTDQNRALWMKNINKEKKKVSDFDWFIILINQTQQQDYFQHKIKDSAFLKGVISIHEKKR